MSEKSNEFPPFHKSITINLSKISSNESMKRDYHIPSYHIPYSIIFHPYEPPTCTQTIFIPLSCHPYVPSSILDSIQSIHVSILSNQQVQYVEYTILQLYSIIPCQYTMLENTINIPFGWILSIINLFSNQLHSIIFHH